VKPSHGDNVMLGRVLYLVARTRLSLSTEKLTQSDLDEALTKAEIPFEREKRLAPGDIPDFMVDGSIAVEVKIKGAQRRQIYRQLERYAKHDAVVAVVLVTNLSMALPREINGKPAFVASMGSAWL
jgi:hypothetical protein